MLRYGCACYVRGVRGDRAATGRLVQLCKRGVATTGDAEELFALLEQATGAAGVVFAQAFTFAGGWCHTRNVSSAWLETHNQHEEDDPAELRLGVEPLGTAYLVQRDTPADFKRTALFAALPEHGFGDVAIARLYSPFRSDLCVGLYRPLGARPFDEADRTSLELLFPMIARGVSSRRSLAMLESVPRRPGVAAADEWGHVSVSLPAGTIEWSRAARTLLRARLAVDGVGWARVDAMLVAATRRFLSSAEGARSQRLPGGLCLELAIVPPRARERQRILGWLLPDEDSGMGVGPASELLSDKQRAVARAAAAGQTVEEMGRAFGVTSETIRTHLREIYRRLGVRDRRALARVLEG